jgi:hypothetical protein
MSSVKRSVDKSEKRKSRVGLGFRDLFARKKETQAISSNSLQRLEKSDTESIQKHAPITVHDVADTAVDEPPDIGALPYVHASLPLPDAQSRQSLTSHRSKGSFSADRIYAQNEYV